MNLPGELCVTPAIGATLDEYNNVVWPYNRRPGWGGKLQHPTAGGYHQLYHAGAIFGVAVADYSRTVQLQTQAGQRNAFSNIYSVTYQSI